MAVMWSRFRALSALLGAAAALHAAPSAACSRPAPLEFTLDPGAAGVDVQPPTRPERVTATLTRTSGTYCATDGSCLVSSCGSGGTLQLQFSPASDDRSAANELGYRLRLLEGSLPPALEAPLGRIWVGETPLRIELPFDPVPELDARFELIAIDRAANESEASEPFHVAFDGCTRAVGMNGCAEDTGGRVSCADGACYDTSELASCAAAPGREPSRAGFGLLLVTLAAALARRRRAAAGS